jgi:histidine ammonia-lyase
MANPSAPVELVGPLWIEDVVRIVRGARATLSENVLRRVDAARQVVAAAVEAGSVVYGVTTGFVGLANVRLAPDHSTALQQGLLRSHAVAVDNELSAEEVRAMLALRAHDLALGHSGSDARSCCGSSRCSRETFPPVVPEQGSLGASGDLAPLAHLALPVIGEGEVGLAGERLPAIGALHRCGLEPMVLEAKEGLALINDTQGMTAIGALAAWRATRLAKIADISAALTIEAILGTDRAFDPRVVGLRQHPGQLASARNLVRLLTGSDILSSHRERDQIVQDSYSIRCAPQVHGAFRDVVRHGVQTLEIELAWISERRLFWLLDPKTSNGLPAFLVGEAGVNSGFMVCQYTAASLVSEMKNLAHPAAIAMKVLAEPRLATYEPLCWPDRAAGRPSRRSA